MSRNGRGISFQDSTDGGQYVKPIPPQSRHSTIPHISLVRRHHSSLLDPSSASASSPWRSASSPPLSRIITSSTLFLSLLLFCPDLMLPPPRSHSAAGEHCCPVHLLPRASLLHLFSPPLSHESFSFSPTLNSNLTQSAGLVASTLRGDRQNLDPPSVTFSGSA